MNIIGKFKTNILNFLYFETIKRLMIGDLILLVSQCQHETEQCHNITRFLKIKIPLCTDYNKYAFIHNKT